jgi:FkbM family methyltransferase
MLKFLAGTSSQMDVAAATRLVAQSQSQLGQDVFALTTLDFKRDGFFIEFGATDGVSLSNTWLLEKEFGWTGILAEPAKGWHKKLRENRASIISESCVWKESGTEISFSESAELSTITKFKDADLHSAARRSSSTYNVVTISLMDLCIQNNAPKHIDFISIDTEGSEFEILSQFDFESYKVSVICVEHNYTKNRLRIKKLLEKNGFERIFEDLSQFDDWYIHRKNLDLNLNLDNQVKS